MKRLLLLLLLAIPFTINEVTAQKVKLRIDKVDKFENRHLFATDWIKVYGAMKMPSSIYFSIEHLHDVTYLSVKIITGCVDLVPKDAEAKFIMADGTQHTLQCVSDAWASHGDGAIGLAGSNALGLNILYKGDLSFLAGDVTDVRFEGKEYNYDAEIKPKAQKLIKAMYKVYTNQLNK